MTTANTKFIYWTILFLLSYKPSPLPLVSMNYLDAEQGVNGQIWMDRNLGATQAATSSTDAASYGGLYQCGRCADGHQSRTSAITTQLVTGSSPGHGDFINSSFSHDWTNFVDRGLFWQSGLNDPCPTGYRIPTDAEFNAERVYTPIRNSAQALLALKLPLAGFRYNGILNSVDVQGYYWTSTTSTVLYGRILKFWNTYAQSTGSYRDSGLSVRCIKE